MARFALLLTSLAILSLASRRADAQGRHTFISWSAEMPSTHSLMGGREVAASDSVRQKVGYNHWKGAAIGGAAGGVAGLLLGLMGCSDCDPDIPGTALVSAVVVGAFGFLTGSASPRYRWGPDTAAHTP